MERTGRLLVPDGDRRLGERAGATGAVGGHSLWRTFVWDAWTVGLQWWRRFGPDRPVHGTAHDVLMAIPGIGGFFRSMGVLPAAPDAIATALAQGRDVAVWPGGDLDSLRPWRERDRANLAGRKGFVKMAIRAGVPIVPIATVGGADAMPVLMRGRPARARIATRPAVTAEGVPAGDLVALRDCASGAPATAAADPVHAGGRAGPRSRACRRRRIR